MITLQQQPTNKSCGHTVLAMILGVPAPDIVAELRNRGLPAGALRSYLQDRGYVVPAPRPWGLDTRVHDPRMLLPSMAIVRIDWTSTRARTHWVLWAERQFFDPDLANYPADLRDKPNAWALAGGRLYSYMPVVRPEGEAWWPTR
jgi:hypothetical protein